MAYIFSIAIGYLITKKKHLKVWKMDGMEVA